MIPEGGTSWTVCRNCEHTAWWHDGVECHWTQCLCVAFQAVPAAQSPDPEWWLDSDGYVRAPLSYENREGDPAFNGAFDRW